MYEVLPHVAFLSKLFFCEMIIETTSFYHMSNSVLSMVLKPKPN